MATAPKSTAMRVPKAGEMVAAHLRRQIVTGELQEGNALPPEADLMEQFGVSRPTLREAFRVLESEQLIQIRRGAHGGAHVLVPDSAAASRFTGTLLQYRGTTLADVHQARAQLEAAGVGILARKRTAADLRTLEDALAEGDEMTSDPIGFAEKHDLQFHRLLMELAGNETMIVLLEMLLSIVEQHSQSIISAHRDDNDAVRSIRATQRAHKKLVGHIRDKSSDQATVFWRKHLTKVGEFLTSEPAGETVLDLLS